MWMRPGPGSTISSGLMTSRAARYRPSAPSAQCLGNRFKFEKVCMKKPLKQFLVASSLFLIGTAVMAKLPAPSDEAKAKAAEAAAKAVWSGNVDAYLFCKSQDKVAAHYYKTAKTENKDTKPAKETPPCVEPGAFSYTPAVVAKPLEESGAHSPAPTATSPPGSTTPAAAIAPAK